MDGTGNVDEELWPVGSFCQVVVSSSYILVVVSSLFQIFVSVFVTVVWKLAWIVLHIFVVVSTFFQIFLFLFVTLVWKFDKVDSMPL